MGQIKTTLIARLSENLNVLTEGEVSMVKIMGDEYDTFMITTNNLLDKRDAIKRDIREEPEEQYLDEFTVELDTVNSILNKLHGLTLLLDAEE